MLNTNRIENFRIKEGPLGSDASNGANGAFEIKWGGKRFTLVLSDGMGWEHVSISSTPIPTWAQMCYFKDLLWHPEDCVIQYHPPASEYVNCHPNCLHLWRPMGLVLPLPPRFMVGPK